MTSDSNATDLIERLEHHLDGVGARATIRPATVATAAGRARQRQRRRNVSVAACTVLLVVSTITAVAVVRRPVTTLVDVDRPDTITSDTIAPDTTAPDTTAPDTTLPDTTTPDTTVGATTSPADDGGAEATVMITPDGSDPTQWSIESTLAWTIADDASAPSDVFVSVDGVTWRAVPTGPQLAVRAGERDASGTIRLVGLSTGADPSRALMVTSTDEGASWTMIELPVDLGPIETDPTLAFTFYASLASRNGATVIAANTAGTDQHLLTVLGDGTVLDATPSGLQLDGEYIGQVFADDLGFVVSGNVTSDVTTTTVWVSTDGLTWTTSASTEQSVIPAGRLGSTLVSSGSVLTTSTDGATWTPYDLDGALGRSEAGRWVPQVTRVVDGRLMVVAKADGTQGVATVVKDGIRIDISRNLDTTFSDAATGAHLGGSVGAVTDGPVRTVGATFELLDDAGAVRVSFSLEEATAAVATIVDRPDEWVVAATTDLEHWVTTDITDLLPATASVIQVGFVDGRPTVVAVELGLGGPIGPYSVVRTSAV